MNYSEIEEFCRFKVYIHRAKGLFRFDDVIDDLMQECLLVAWKVQQSYDSNRGASFKTYLNNSLNYFLWRHYKKQRNHQYHLQYDSCNNNKIELNISIENRPDEKIITVPLTIAKVETILGGKLKNKQNGDRLKQLIIKLDQGFTKSDIAREWSISRQRVKQLVNEIQSLVVEG